MKVRSLRLTALLWIVLWALPSLAIETNLRIHDPSTIVKRGDTYWVYGTGTGIPQFSSTDRLHWTPRGPVFAEAPAWVANVVPANKNNLVWAPDIRLMNGRYYLYYSYSRMGSQKSAIGVATSTTLEPNSWVDQGVVVFSGRSTAKDSFNTIDPCIFEDANGRFWLSFGSFFGGIKLVEINPATGKAANRKIYSIAARPNTRNNAIEASTITYHDGYYYLFVNWDKCCAHEKSSYNIHVGRSRSVTGPYVGKLGADMMQGGGSLFLSAVYDDGSNRLIDEQVGPGHVGILHDTDGDWVSIHYEWASDTTTPMLNINRLAWDSSGWPRFVLDPGPYKLVTQLSTHSVVAATDGAALQTARDNNSEQQKWTLNYRGDGFYQIINAASQKALSVVGCTARPGARVELTTPRNDDCQLWYLRQSDDGAYALVTKTSQEPLVLDILRCSPTAGTPLQVWTSNGLPCQKWMLRLKSVVR